MNRKLKQTFHMKITQNSSRKKHGFMFWLIAFLIVCFALAAYSFLWIPAIGFIIYFAIRHNYSGTKVRNIVISSIIMITSLTLFIAMRATPNLTSIQADWGQAEFDISDTAEVKITGYPGNADIDSLELSKNNIASLDYRNGKAVVTFTDTGKVSLFFTANNEIDSSATTITVVDKAAEEQARKEAQEQAEREAQEQAEREAQEQAEREAQEQAEREAQEQAEREAQEQATQSQIVQETDSQEETVWIPQSGKKYHSNPSCSSMKNPREVTITEAQNMGYEPCKRCY